MTQDWPRVPLGYLSAVPIANGLGLSGQYDNPDWPRYVRTTDIRDARRLRDDVFASQPPEVARAAMLQRGDILMTAAGATIGKSVTFDEDYDACFAGFLARFRPGPSVDGRFVSFWMQSQDYWDQVQANAVRSTIDNFSASKYRALRIPLPPLDEQRRIANYLDDQTTRIDQAIQLRQQQVSLIPEMLQTLIDRTLLDLGAPFVRASRLLSVTPGHAFSSEGFDATTGIRLLRGINVGVGRIDWDETARWNGPEHVGIAKFELSPGDVVLGMDRPWISGGMRIARLSEDDCPSYLLQRVARLEPRGSALLPDYVYWCFRMTAFRSTVETDLSGISIPHLSAEQIVSHTLPVVRVDVQARIVDRLEQVELHNERLAGLLTAQVAVLLERKRSLITAALTGSLDVSSASSRAADVMVSGVGGGV